MHSDAITTYVRAQVCRCMWDEQKRRSCTRLLAIYEAGVGLKAELINSRVCALHLLVCKYVRVCMWTRACYRYFIRTSLHRRSQWTKEINHPFHSISRRDCARLFFVRWKIHAQRGLRTISDVCTCKCFVTRCVANGWKRNFNKRFCIRYWTWDWSYPNQDFTTRQTFDISHKFERINR